MPLTEKITDAGIQIELAVPPDWTFNAGNMVIGNVVRRAPIVAPEATVTLALFGRVKTKISVTRNQQHKTSHYRGRWHLLAPKHEIIFRGPLHLPKDRSPGTRLTWPFSITIPTHPEASVLSDHFSDESFLPLDKQGIAQTPLPGTFFSNSHGFRTSSEGFVEYYLEAYLQYTHGGKPWTIKAISPLTIRHPIVGDGFLGFDPRRLVFTRKVQSQRLVPGMEHAELSFKQHAKKFFGSSTVPEFHYNVEMMSPRVIQLDNPSPIPFIISIIPQQHKTSAEIKDVSQTFRLNWVSMVIRSKTDVLAPSNFGHRSHNDTHSCDHNLLKLENLFRVLKKPVMISTGKGNGPVDIGGLLQLVLRPSGLSARNQHLGTVPTIHPDFVTYNIKHSHSLKWEVSLTVAEETQKFQMGAPLNILAAA